MATLSSIITPSNVLTATNVQTVTNKTISGASNTISNVSLTTGVTGTLPVANGGTGITSLGTGVATFLGTPSSANLAAAVTDETGSGALVFGTSAALTTPTITGTKETSVAVAASNIDLSLGNYFTKTISGTTTFTASNVPTTGTTASFILDLTNGGSATVNWITNTTWAAGTPPTLTASGRDVLAFFTYDAGTTWNGFVLGTGMA